MAVDKLVDSAQLDADLTSVANAIRTKGGTSSDLAFPAGFVSAVEAIPTGGGTEYWETSRGTVYVKDMVLDVIYKSGSVPPAYRYAENMETLVCNEDDLVGGSAYRVNYYFGNCTKLKTASFPYLQGIETNYTDGFLGWATSLESVQFGSVGHPVTALQNSNPTYKLFQNCTQSGLTITIYVDAATLADVPAAVKTKQPWGATNATVVYRSSTTGEVLT